MNYLFIAYYGHVDLFFGKQESGGTMPWIGVCSTLSYNKFERFNVCDSQLRSPYGFKTIALRINRVGFHVSPNR